MAINYSMPLGDLAEGLARCCSDRKSRICPVFNPVSVIPLCPFYPHKHCKDIETDDWKDILERLEP